MFEIYGDFLESVLPSGIENSSAIEGTFLNLRDFSELVVRSGIENISQN
jgi:hypothetical protein